MTTQNGWTKYNESENNNQNSVLFIEKQNVSVCVWPDEGDCTRTPI